MTFWSLSDGSKPTGSAEDSNASATMIIPNNTLAKAKIMKFENVTMPSGDKMLIVNWKLEDTKSRGSYVNQKLKVFDSSPSKKDRAINTLVRLYKIGNIKPTQNDCPSDEELAQFKGRLMGIKVQQWFYQGKEGNWVSEVHPADDFVSEDGEFLTPPPPQDAPKMSLNEAEKAYGQIAQQPTANFDDDIPF